MTTQYCSTTNNTAYCLSLDNFQVYNVHND